VNWTGILLLTLSLACLQVVLEQGHQLDWLATLQEWQASSAAAVASSTDLAWGWSLRPETERMRRVDPGRGIRPPLFAPPRVPDVSGSVEGLPGPHAEG
jgi:hypothetical protein